MIVGVDVSHHNGKIYWEQLLKQKIRFAIIKATQGTSFKDPEFFSNIRNAETAGIMTGSYHFLDNSDPVKQAEHYYSTVSYAIDNLNVDHAFVPVVDVEENPLDNNNLPKGEVVQGFLEETERLWGVKPIIYSRTDILERYVSYPFFGKYDTWIAHWSNVPPRLKEWNIVLWQQGVYKFPVINKELDLDVFVGSYYDLKNLLRDEELIYKYLIIWYENLYTVLINDLMDALDGFYGLDYESIVPAFGEIIAENLNVRSGPSIQYQIMDVLPKGSIVRIHEESNGWYRIGENAWVYGKYVRRVPL